MLNFKQNVPVKIINWFLFLFHRKPHQHCFATCLLSGAPPGIIQAVKDQGESPLPPLHTLLSAARPFSYLDSVFSCKNCTRDEAQDILSLKWQKKKRKASIIRQSRGVEGLWFHPSLPEGVLSIRSNCPFYPFCLFGHSQHTISLLQQALRSVFTLANEAATTHLDGLHGVLMLKLPWGTKYICTQLAQKCQRPARPQHHLQQGLEQPARARQQELYLERSFTGSSKEMLTFRANTTSWAGSKLCEHRQALKNWARASSSTNVS